VRRFYRRGLAGVSAEFLLMALAFNLTRLDGRQNRQWDRSKRAHHNKMAGTQFRRKFRRTEPVATQTLKAVP
jgi:hypothetical protein